MLEPNALKSSCNRYGKKETTSELTITTLAQRFGSGGSYIHPASLSLRAYIFPISPIPMIPTTKPFIVPDSFLDAIVTDPHWISITLLLKRWRTYVEGRESKDEKDEGRNFSHGTIARWSLVGG
jgi:hypothetical protein